VVNSFSCKPVSKKKGSGFDFASLTMQTGQIILIAKMLTQSDLAFYEFVDSKPMLKWKRETAISG